jgi:membrane-bound lytic murein transglycosylase D
MTNAGDATAVAAAEPAPAQTRPVPPAAPKTHKVQRGDTANGIARKFGCDLRDFVKANKLKAPKYAIRPGQPLTLEGCKG